MLLQTNSFVNIGIYGHNFQLLIRTNLIVSKEYLSNITLANHTSAEQPR